MSTTANVLAIDDQSDETRRLLEVDSDETPEIEVDVVHPQELEPPMLEAAHLIILDYKLGDWWPQGTPMACQPSDGLALMAVISAHLRRTEEPPKRRHPTALTLISGDLSALATSDVVPHPHLIARAFGLDWAFDKTKPQDLAHQVTLLARAVRDLPLDWPDEPQEAENSLRRLLKLDESPSPDLGWSDVMRTTPPLHELSRATDGISVLRWLLHRILPYPTFLWSTHRLATRFRVRHRWVLEQIHTNGPFARLLAPARYQGVLAGFLGERWWGAGVEEIVWDKTDGASLSIDELHAWLEQEIGCKLEAVGILHPVICLDENYLAKPELASMDDCVRLQRDDWPAHADAPWISIDIARERPDIASRVIESDRDKLGEDDDDEDLP